MNILSLTPQNQEIIKQAAQLLTDAFREHWPEAWPTFEDSVKEIQEMLDEERICRISIDDEENLLGIIGASHNTMDMSGNSIRSLFNRTCSHEALDGPWYWTLRNKFVCVAGSRSSWEVMTKII